MLDRQFNLGKGNSNSDTVLERITKAKKKVEAHAMVERGPVMEEDLSYSKTSTGEDKLSKVLGLPYLH